MSDSPFSQPPTLAIPHHPAGRMLSDAELVAMIRWFGQQYEMAMARREVREPTSADREALQGLAEVTRLAEEARRREQSLAHRQEVNMQAAFLGFVDAVEREIVREAAPLPPSREGGAKIFKFLGRRNDENLYSDFMAALLSPQKTGKFAFELLRQILGAAGFPHVSGQGEWSYLRVRREVHLSEFGVRERDANRRIDLLLLTDQFQLVIENKTLTQEHDRQTVTYFNAVSERFVSRPTLGIFLTQDGSRAEDERYKSLTYLGLAHAIARALHLSPPEAKDAAGYAASLLNDLIDQFGGLHRAIHRAAESRRRVYGQR